MLVRSERLPSVFLCYLLIDLQIGIMSRVYGISIRKMSTQFEKGSPAVRNLIVRLAPETHEITEADQSTLGSSYLDQMPTDDEVNVLHSFLRTKKNLLVITGAGISTSSGVPDYRGPLGSYKLGPEIFSD